MRDLLDAETLTAQLAGLDGWKGDTSSISRVVSTTDDQRDRLLSELEAIAREMNHDPDLEFLPGGVQITMSTHSAGGVTELDVEYARRVDVLVGQLGG